MTEEDRRVLCNLPSYEEMRRTGTGFMNPGTRRNWVVFADGDVKVGVVNSLKEEKEVFIGVGVNPVLCGKHYGRRMLETAAWIAWDAIPEERCIPKAGYGTGGR